MEWIDVKDQWPRDLCQVLLFARRLPDENSDSIFTGHWDNLNRVWVVDWMASVSAACYQTFFDNFELKKSRVSYWMPLPKPPKREFDGILDPTFEITLVPPKEK